MKQKEKTRNLAVTGVMAAFIFLVTAYLFHIPAGAAGYVHFGDALIYLSACFLPVTYAMAAAAVGAALSDIMTPGGAIWLPATIIIKPLLVLFFTANSAKIVCKRNLWATAGAGALNLFGYAMATYFIAGSYEVAMYGVVMGLVQFCGSGAFFFVCAFALDRISFKDRIFHASK